MHRLRTGGFGRCQNTRPLQVAVFGGVAAHVHGFIAHVDVLGLRVRIGVNRYGLHAHARAGGRDTAGDLATVGDEDFFEHGDRSFFYVG